MKLRMTCFLVVSLCFLYACKKQMELFTGVEEQPVLETEIGVNGPTQNIDKPSILRLFSPNNQFNGYGFASLIRLSDTSLMVAATRYFSFDDFKNADIVAKRSFDNGNTWTDEYQLQSNIGLINILAPSLVRISENHIMLFFTAKNSFTDMPLFFKESKDNGNTWTEPRVVNFGLQGYTLLNNDRVIYSNKRIIIPLAYARNISQEYNQQVSFTIYSDDLGKTWTRSNILKANFALMEPGIAKVGSNNLLMTIRSTMGFVYFARSGDNGKTWGGLLQTRIQTPESPQTIHRIGSSDTLLMLWNNRKYTPGHENRNPLTLAYSIDNGNSWKNPMNIRSDSNFNYFYPTVDVFKDSLHITYGIRRRFTYKPSIYYEKISLKEVLK